MINVTVVTSDGNPVSRELDEGTRLSAVVPSGMTGLLNGESVPEGRDPELRTDDSIRLNAKAVKAGS